MQRNLRIVDNGDSNEKSPFSSTRSRDHTPYRLNGDTTLAIVRGAATRQAYGQGRHLEKGVPLISARDRRFSIFLIAL